VAYHLVQAALNHPKVKGLDKLVLIDLAERARADTDLEHPLECWPGAQTVCDRLGIAKSTYWACIERLVRARVLQRYQKDDRYHTTHYHMRFAEVNGVK